MDRERDYRDYHGGYGGDRGDRGHDGGFRRTPGKRPVTDYGTAMVQWMRHTRLRPQGGSILEAERPSPSYIVDMLPPSARPSRAADTIAAKHLHASQNRLKHPINVVRWTPEGRRCLTCSSDGEFTLWNGMAFNFETILRAHDSAIRAAVYSHSEEWLISADHDGVVKFWQPNFNNVRSIQAHDDPIRDLAFSPNDERYVTACDDATLKIYNFAADRAESVLTGHNWDAKSVDWHRSKGLLASGSKDHQVKLWDPRTGRCLTTLHGHKNTISKTSFDPHKGHLLATCARDQTARLFDLRVMRDVCLLRGFEPRPPESRGPEKEKEASASTLTWHPIHSSLLSLGGSDGSIFHYLLDEPNTPANTLGSVSPYDSVDPRNAPAQTIYPAHKIPHAHQWAVWSLSWHPLGHILASGSNDRITRFWTRPRPGETAYLNDIFHLDAKQAEAQGLYDRRRGRQEMLEAEEQEKYDEADGLVDQTMPALPGLPGLSLGTDASNGKLGANPSRFVPGEGAMPAGVVPPPPLPPNLAGIDPGRLSALIAEGKLPIPPPPIPGQGFPPPPPNFDLSKLPPEMMAKFPPPLPGMASFQPPGGPSGVGQPGESNAGSASSVRKRGPLPSQQESLKEHQRGGKLRSAR